MNFIPASAKPERPKYVELDDVLKYLREMAPLVAHHDGHEQCLLWIANLIEEQALKGTLGK